MNADRDGATRKCDRVLVTGGEEVGVLGALRALRRAGYEPWASVTTPRSYAARSRAVAGTVTVPQPERDAAGFAGVLADAAANLQPVAVLPGTEAALVALAPARELFPANVAVGCPTPEIVARATNKTELESLARRAGLQMPPTASITERLEEDVNGFAFPLVAKPRRSLERDGDGRLAKRSAILVEDVAELRRAVDGFAEGKGLVQPYLAGPIYGLCGVAWEGLLVCSLHQLGKRIWPVDCGMVSYVETIPRDVELDEAAARVVADLGWSGIFQLQFLRHEGRLYLIDLNPRIYISVSLAASAGMNLPAIWVGLLRGGNPETDDYSVGVRWRSDQDDPRSIALTLWHGPRRKALAGLLPRRRTTHAVFSWRDPNPTLVSLERLTRRRVRGSLGREA